MFVIISKNIIKDLHLNISDLEDNMNLNRIENPTDKDYDRLKKYKKAKRILEEEN